MGAHSEQGRKSTHHKENPMSLGVLNNLSAIYAENNLNNSNNSLSKTLQQLSSGSKINGGADDAAGLSLVNGLQANQTALTQSQTNASEGVAMLQVADGALSQVTNLLNRAVTLATEASNGSLTGSQYTAANQEYQSILDEVNNIGTTTTYNQSAVFNSNTNIYTGDSSMSGASINDLNIRTLSASNLGDTQGVMSYNTGSNTSNVFVDLSNDGVKATANDSLGLSTATTVVTVNHLTTGANGQLSNTQSTITVGNGTNYANSVQGLMSAINGAGLGLTASFGTAAQAGAGAVATANAAVYGGGSAADTGIIITGAGVGAGTNAGQIGTLVTTGNSSLDPLTGTLNVTDANGTAHTVTLGQADSTDNIANLAATINAAGYGITATAGGTNNATLTFTSASTKAAVSGVNLTDAATSTDATQTITPYAGASTPGTSNTASTMKLTLGAAGDILTGGTITIKGQDSGVAAQAFTLGQSGATDNLADLVKTINTWATKNPLAGLTASTNGTILTISNSGETSATAQTPTITLGAMTADSVATAAATSLTGTPTVGLNSATTVGTLALTGAGSAVTDVLNGTLKIGTNSITLGGTGTTDTLQDLAKTINAGSYGVTATYSQANQNIVFTSSNSALAANTPLVTIGYTAATGALGSGDQTDLSGTLAYTAKAANATTAESFYTIGVASASISDSATAVGANNGGTVNTGITADMTGNSGIATISYTDGSGQSLSATDLSNQNDAETALTQINTAISDVAAQDGYIGAQINTLNSVSSVLSTQQENVISAQNAVQATDYAMATSNMSKYEILSQTGIAALAQANSIQQEVTKLLQ
jgi:flagellin